MFGEPMFESGEQAETFLGLALRHYRETEAGLGHAGGHRAVLDFVREGAGGVALDATGGCQGHASGMSL